MLLRLRLVPLEKSLPNFQVMGLSIYNEYYQLQGDDSPCQDSFTSTTQSYHCNRDAGLCGSTLQILHPACRHINFSTYTCPRSRIRLPKRLPSSRSMKAPFVNEMEECTRERVMSCTRRSIPGHLPILTYRYRGVNTMNVLAASSTDGSFSRTMKGMLGHSNSTRLWVSPAIFIQFGRDLLQSSHQSLAREQTDTILFSSLRTLLWIQTCRQEKWTYWQLPRHSQGEMRSSPPSPRQILQTSPSDLSAGEKSAFCDLKGASSLFSRVRWVSDTRKQVFPSLIISSLTIGWLVSSLVLPCLLRQMKGRESRLSECCSLDGQWE